MKISIDREKAKSLQKMANVSLARLNETNKLKYPSNTLNDHYDIIHKLCESLSLLEGIKFNGEGAHKELINFVVKKYKFTNQESIFLQEMRKLRNRISYEGFQVHQNYIKLNEKIIKDIIKKLIEIIQETI